MPQSLGMEHYEHPLSLRPFQSGDLDGFRALVESVLDEYGFVPDPVLESDLRDPVGKYDQVWVAVDGDAVVGSVALRQLGKGELELKRMYLYPDYRGRGLGKRLLEQALQWARAEGAVAIVLDTSEAMLEAQRLYESVGFVRTGLRTERGEFDSRCEVLYRLTL